MNIVIFYGGVIPVFKYGGTQRVIWGLGKALIGKGHRVSYLAARGSWCDFADVIHYDPMRPFAEQVPEGTDIVHLNTLVSEPVGWPFLCTVHGNGEGLVPLPVNTVFVSQDHARRHGAEAFVHNGLDWDEYGVPDLKSERSYFHFLGNAAWRIKNVKGAIDVVRGMPGERLMVLGGNRLNVKMGFRLTLSPKISFKGMVGGDAKLRLLAGSKGLVFPVRWHEPFGLAVTESLYFGTPVFGTPYGALPELVTAEVGCLSDSCSGLREAMKAADGYSRRVCHEYARDVFSADRMADNYLKYYERVLSGEALNLVPPQLRTNPTEGKFLPWHA